MSSPPTQTYRRARKSSSPNFQEVLGSISERMSTWKKIAGEMESLVRAGYTHIRTTKNAPAIIPIGGGSQTVKLSRLRQIPELTNSMNNRTVESQLDSWLQYPGADLSQHSLAKAVSKITKKPREAESLSDKLAGPCSYPSSYSRF